MAVFVTIPARSYEEFEKLDGIQCATFVYDGDGNRVKKTENGQTTLYVNKYYEKNLTTGVTNSYYYLGNRRIAEREDSTLRYFHQDSLSSTSLMTDASGGSLGTMKFAPFGSARTGSIPTDIQFTGQRLDDTGLYFYNTRYYDASIGRFISPDSFVQNPLNPQTWNRYSYTLNNPLKYIDPSGHLIKIGPLTISNDTYTYTGSPTGDESKIIQAWERFKQVAPDEAKLMEDTPTTYTITFRNVSLGSVTLGNDGNQWIGLDPRLKTYSVEQIATTIAHESVHARQGKQSFTPWDWNPATIFEEVVAYKYEYEISIMLGLNPSPDVVSLYNINLAGGVALNSNLLTSQSILINMFWAYRFFPLGYPSIVFPIPLGNGLSLWGYSLSGTPMVLPATPPSYYYGKLRLVWWLLRHIGAK